MLFGWVKAFSVAGLTLFLIFAEPGSVEAQDLRFSSGEKINIDIYGRADLSGERTLDGSGRISIPLLGRIKVSDLTVDDLEKTIADLLQEKGLVDSPFVSIEVVKRRDIFIDGDIARPGAYPWSPELTISHALALGGGQRLLETDELGTALQAYTAIENYQALEKSIASLRAREARLRTELEFAALVFDEFPTTELDEVKSLSSSSRPADEVVASTAGTPPVPTWGPTQYSLTKFRSLQQRKGALRLINFPEEVLSDPALADIRSTQEGLIESRIYINLATMNSMQQQLAHMREKLVALEKRKAIVDEIIDELRKALQRATDLKRKKLVLSKDVLDLQTALSGALSSQFEVLDEITEAQLQIQRQELSIRGYATTLRQGISTDLEQVTAELAQALSRYGSAKRAAAVAKAYRFTNANELADIQAIFEIRRGEDRLTADLGTVLLPGDSIFVSILEE